MGLPPKPPLPRSLLWEIPLAILSFCFFKMVKAIIGFFYGIYLNRDRTRATQWKILSADTLKIPIVLPVLMTKGPRWNTHAIIGTVGPFTVQQSITLDLSLANQSAQSWTVVVYQYPSYATIAQINSLEYGQSDQHDLELEPGRYSLGVRYYEYADSVTFPTVRIDQANSPLDTAEAPPAIATQTVSGQTNHFYQTLCDRTNCFYLALHYYIYTVLQLRPWLPESFVTREYLPVGNPDTLFLFDAVAPQHMLNIQVNPTVLQSYELYFTLYNRASLPLYYTKVQAEQTEISACSRPGYYLIRARPRNTQAPDLINNTLIQVQSLLRDA